MILIKLNHSGDTIVEVLLSLVVISMVLAGAYSITSFSLQTEVNSQHRSQATQIAQSQLEILKNQATDIYQVPTYITNVGVNPTDTFCMVGNNLKVYPAYKCSFNSDGTANTSSSTTGFTVRITNISSAASPWSNVSVNVTWNSTSGSSTLQQLNLIYGFDNAN